MRAFACRGCVHERTPQDSDPCRDCLDGREYVRRLSSDVARCHDDGCPAREVCQRWRQRETGRVHAASLRFQEGCEQCDYTGGMGGEE